MPLPRAQLAAMIDHTLLAPESTDAAVEALCAEGIELSVKAVCVNASRVPAAVRALEGSSVALAAVAGFPSGAHPSDVKAREAAIAVQEGAQEVDMVIDLGAATDGRRARRRFPSPPRRPAGTA
jgi:deoxyribose-phosphate aldolase